MRLAHYLTIGSECNTSIACHLEKLYVVFTRDIPLWFFDLKHHKNISIYNMALISIRDKAVLGWDARVALAVYGAFSSREYLNAQRIR